MIKTDEVFVTGLEPEITYVDRSEQGLENAVVKYLEKGGAVLTISGPSKSGKSTLANRVLRQCKQPYIRITGASLHSMSDFWQIVAHRASIPTQKQNAVEHGDAFEVSLATSAGGGIIPANISAEFKSQLNAKEVTTSSTTIVLSESVKDVLQDLGIALVIDDFHYAPEDVRRELARELKDLVFNKARVILIAIPERVMEILQSEGELNGRLDKIIVKEWKPLELMRIAAQGFAALNVTDKSRGQIIEKLVQESYSSPLLMQVLCGQLCKDNNVHEAVAESQELVEPYWPSFFSLLAKNIQPSIIEHLKIGPVERRRRSQRPLINGGSVDMYSGVLMAIHRRMPHRSATPLEISDTMVTFLESRPQLQRIRQTCEKMADIADLRKGSSDSAIDFGSDPQRLNIVDPYLAFFIAWGLRELDLPV